MQVVAIQLDIVWEDRQANHDKVNALLKTVELEPGALVVLPELWPCGFSFNIAAICEGDDKPTEKFMAQLAKQRDIYVLGGVVQQAPDGRGRNQAVVFGPQGDQVARYTKLHPFSFGQEPDHYDAGDKLVSFDWQGCSTTPLICYDLRFPEVFRKAVRRGTEFFAVIANFPTPRVDHWIALNKARAIENQAYVIAVNRCGNDPNNAYPGRSMVIDPHGQVLADGGGDEGVITADIDLASLKQYRTDFPALQDMRDDPTI